MGTFIIVLAAIVALVILGALAQAFGADSRQEFEDPRAPARISI